MKNKPLVSIIIPTKNSESTLLKCLLSIKKQTYKNIEIIVVDNESDDKTKLIAKKYAHMVLNQGPERSAQRNFGAKKAKGNYLFFIDSDMILTKELVEEAIETVTDYKKKTLVIPEKSIGTGFWSRCKAMERSFYLGVDWMEAARFFEKDIFWEFDGYDEHNTGTEDYDLPQRIISKMGIRTQGRIKSFIIHDEGKLTLIGTIKKKFYYSQKLKQYSEKSENKNNFKKQSSLIRRYILFFSDPKKMLKDPVTFVGMVILKTVEFISGGLGLMKSYI